MSDYPDPQRALDDLQAGIRRRLRVRWALQSLAAVLLVLLLAGILAATLMAVWRFDAEVVSAARWLVGSLAGILVTTLGLALVVHRLPDRTLAHYVESRLPHLDALLITAVEAAHRLRQPSATDHTSAALARRLVQEAVRHCRANSRVMTLERGGQRWAGVALAGVLALGLGAAALGPVPLRHGMGLLLGYAAEASPYVIRVSPGTVSVLQGSDQRITATPRHFRPHRMELVSRAGPDRPWTRSAMVAAAGDEGFESYLFNLETAWEYYVDAGDLRSPTHRIEVVPRPGVERIDLVYHYPPATGRPPQAVTDGGDISAVRGTRVLLRIVPDRPVERGRLRVDGERTVALAAVDGVLETSLELQQDGYYHVELAAGPLLAPASPDYAITTWDDRLPTVALEQPGRDWKATAIEEVDIRVRAADDVAIGALELVLSVNGGPDEVISLKDRERADATGLTGHHRLYLEERGLAPGDLLAYYARVRDADDAPDRQVTTDMYFIDIRPFEQHFRRASGGGGGGGGGGQNPSDLSAQQRNLVVALFKTARDRAILHDTERHQRLETLAKAQARIHERVTAIVRRLQARSVMDLSKGLQRMAEELPKAAGAMVRTEALLTARDVEQALPAARQALLHLQRADSAFRDVRIAQSQSRGGGGASADDLSNLFRLEMDRFRNPYADLQRGQRQTAQEQAIDETLRKLEELARRQQQEIDRARRRAQSGQGSADSQQALAEQLEEMVRQLQRLSRERPDPQLADTLRQLEQAAQAMRQAAQGGGSGGGSGGDADASARQALDRLRQARRLLDSQGPARLAGEMNEALRRSQSLLDEQRRIRRELQSRVEAGETDADAVRPLAEDKREMAGAVEALRRDLARLSAGADRQQAREARDQLDQAGRTLAENRLVRRFEEAAQAMLEAPEQQARRDESAIEAPLRAARDRIAAAAASVAGEGPEGREQAREELRGLVRAMEGQRDGLVDRVRGSGLGTGGGAWDADDLAGVRQELRDQTRRLADLARRMADTPGAARDIESLIAAMDDEASRTGTANPQAITRRYAQWLATLKGVERTLRDPEEGEAPAVVGVQRAEPAARYRALVESYYRKLSEAPVHD